jgi:hypothetical protein
MALRVATPCDPGFRELLRQALAAEQGQHWDVALGLYRRLHHLRPGDHRLIANAGRVCWLADRPGDAYGHYANSALLAPSEPILWLGVANALRDLNRFEEADAACQHSWSLDAQPITAWNHSQLLIGLERYAQAYCLAEQRLQLSQLQSYRPLEPERAFNLAACQRIHLWSEQGFGDGLQYLRWCVPLSVAASHELVLELDAPLASLAREGLSWLEQPPQVVAQRTPAPSLAATAGHASLLSLPHHLGGAPLNELFEPTTRPGHWRGYLRSRSWPRRPPGCRPRVGLVWAAGRKLDDPFAAREYRKRTLPPDALGTLLGGLYRHDVELVSLQIGPDHTMAAHWGHAISAALPQSADFALTARWIRQLDLLISVDTAAAHLAGALGHPCWMLLPFSADPRWLRDRHDTPWYPSLRLFRQPSTGQWQPVIADVLEAFSPWWHSASG